ncbi:MAG: FAD-linked oxidase C-terminal domain-containing protein [Nitriliruptoraceae bacterium]
MSPAPHRRPSITSRQANIVEQLGHALPDAALTIDPDILETYRHDRTTWVTPGTPQAVVFPTTVEHVSAALQIANATNTPVVPRGAGSSLCAGAQAIDGCIVLCLERMNDRIDIDVANQAALVDPGVLNADISAVAADSGLWYPPDPASKAFCTIGGNVATNAGGLCCVKYGVTRDYVMGLQVVLADGTVLDTGRQTIKGVAGLDTTGLFVGSEGTLGVVTRVRVRLRPKPTGAATMVAFFGSLGAAGAAVASMTRDGLVLSMMELMDRATIGAVDDAYQMGLDRDAAALLIMQSDSDGLLRDREIARAGELADIAGATYTAVTSDPQESDLLLQARRLAIPAIEPLGVNLLDDVAVPRSTIPDFVGRCEQIAQKRDVAIFTFGHAGDGNFHPTIVADRADGDALRRARLAFDDIVVTALDLGGTITGEHGVGSIKASRLVDELGAANLAVQRRLKAALDPHGILNPGRWL